MVKEDKREEATRTLNGEQKEVFDNLISLINSEEKEFGVTIGYAGTGKTYTISRLIESLEGKIAMTAPTNKAVKVLMDNRGQDNKVRYTTIHKLLSLRVKWVYPKNGKPPFQKLVRTSKGIRGDAPITKYDYVIIDEVSMLDDKLFEMLRKIKKPYTKIIFMGDPAQIPPVNKADAIPLQREHRDTFDIEAYFLEKIMRQESGNKILETSSQIRENRFREGDPIMNRISSNDVIFCSTGSTEDRKLFLSEILNHFKSDAFKEDSNYCKVIAWTNKTVDTYNNIIRKNLFHTETLKPLFVGEKLIADTPVIKDENIVFNTSDEFEVIDFKERFFTYDLPVLPKKNNNQVDLHFSSIDDSRNKERERTEQVFLKYHETEVKFRLPFDDENTERRQTIDVLHPDFEKTYSRILSRLIKKKRYKNYEEMKERFASVKYNYAITTHKSQGSTYGTVFLIEDDINKNRKALERNRIKYTACTRPKTRLFILSSLNLPLKKQLGIEKTEEYDI